GATGRRVSRTRAQRAIRSSWFIRRRMSGHVWPKSWKRSPRALLQLTEGTLGQDGLITCSPSTLFLRSTTSSAVLAPGAIDTETESGAARTVDVKDVYLISDPA